MDVSATWWATAGVIAAFCALALAERTFARRPSVAPWGPRWVANGLYLVAGQGVSIAARMVLLQPAFAWTAQRGSGWRGLVEGPPWLETLVSLVVLDAILYFWHRLNHRVSFLWKWHKAHHLETMMDVSTAVRFHPMELALSALWRAPAVIVLGLTPAELVAFDTAVALAAAFHHANLRLPEAVERMASRWIITPGLHEIHHAQEALLRDRNFGVFFTLWDRLFRSYAGVPADPLRRLGV